MAKDILARMKERAPSFTKGQRAIAGYILDTFEKAAFLTAGRLGRAVGVSESTAIPVCRRSFRSWCSKGSPPSSAWR